jgi:hypothetical protein
MTTTPEKFTVEDDGLICPPVRKWAEEKYRLLFLYDELFASGMKYKWDRRVYIDLYAGAGYNKIQDTETILKGSPTRCLHCQGCVNDATSMLAHIPSIDEARRAPENTVVGLVA